MRNQSLKVMFFAVLLIAAMPVFAQVMPSGLTSLGEDLLDIFTSPFVKAILVMCLCGCAVAYAFNKDNEKMKRNIIAIGIGVAVLAAASQIVDVIFNSASS